MLSTNAAATVATYPFNDGPVCRDDPEDGKSNNILDPVLISDIPSSDAICPVGECLLDAVQIKGHFERRKHLEK